MDLFSPSVRSLIADEHLCIVVNDLVDVLDISCIYKKVSYEGNPLYYQAMMLKIAFYAYAKGVFSSRKIAEAIGEKVGFIFFGSLAAWQRGKPVDAFHKDSFVYDDQRDCYICIEGQELIFSYLQNRDGKEPLSINAAGVVRPASSSVSAPPEKTDHIALSL